MNQTEIALSAQVREGAVHTSSAAGRSILLTRVGGAVQAFENKCPHMGLSLAKGKVEGTSITCPWHGAQYDLCTGKNLQWVNSFVGMKMPEWSHGMIAMGKKPHGLTSVAVTERDGAIYLAA